jgi:CRP/FNR family transcriptional regulator
MEIPKGEIYQDGEYVVRQGETGDCMYLVLTGELEVVRRSGGREFVLAILGEGDFFGEMALVEQDVRSASVRAVGRAVLLKLDKETFLERVQQDPMLAYQLLVQMSKRLRELDERMANLGATMMDDVLEEYRGPATHRTH